MMICTKCHAWVTPGASDCAACGTLLVATGQGAGRSEVARGLRGVSTLYAAVLIAATLADVVIAWTTQYGARTRMGCNFHDALLVGVECRGFPGSGAVELALNLPLLMFYISALVPSAPALIVPAAILWAPVLYLALEIWRKMVSA